MRFTTLLATALLLGLTGCVTKFVDESCQNRGFSPGSAQYEACYPSAAVAIAKTYGGAIQTGLQWPFVQPPPPPAR